MNESTNKSAPSLSSRLLQFCDAVALDEKSRQWVVAFRDLVAARPPDLEVFGDAVAKVVAKERGDRAPLPTFPTSFMSRAWLQDCERMMQSMPPEVMAVVVMICAVMPSVFGSTTDEAAR